MFGPIGTWEFTLLAVAGVGLVWLRLSGHVGSDADRAAEAVSRHVQIAGFVSYGPQSRLVETEARGMAAEQRQALDQFVTQEGSSWFGAFAISPTTEAYGWASARPSMPLAHEAALATCAEDAEDCIVVAELVPTNPAEAPGPVLTHAQAQGLSEAMLHAGVRAFAWSENGAWGTGWSLMGPSAMETAMANCEAFARDTAGDYLPCNAVYLP